MFIFGLQVVVLKIFLVQCEWVEIPQFASKKAYLGVTPFSSYIYDKSAAFTTPTPSTLLDELITPVFIKNNKKDDRDGPKQSITKLPDTLMKNVFSSTTPIPRTSRRWNPKHTTTTSSPKKKNKLNPMQKKKDSALNRTTTSTTTSTTTEKSYYQPTVNKVLVDEHEYDEEVYDDDEEYDERGIPDDDESAELGPEDSDDEYYYDDDDPEYVNEKVGSEEKGAKEGFTYASFLPYLQNIQSTLIRNSHKSAHDKVSFLVEIKNRLLYAIQQKIASLWSSGAKSRKTRSTRGDHPSSWEKGDSGMGFPSNEGALLTLGFLTFAVFLIKCILKLVQAMKGKGGYYGHGGQVVVVVANATAFPGIGKRSISDEETAKMMDLLDTHKYK